MVELNRKQRFLRKPPLKRKQQKTLKNLAIAFVIALIAAVAYVQVSPFTYEAKQRVLLESKLEQTTKQLQSVQDEFDKTLKETEAEKKQRLKKIQELNNEVKKVKQQLEAKRKSATVYAEPIAPTAEAHPGGCAEWMAAAGIPLTDATRKLILNESGCRTGAVNPSSGACGIPQAYPCSKLPCPLDNSGAVCQLKWMDNYVKGRYGSWDNALATWYSRCGSPQGCWY